MSEPLHVLWPVEKAHRQIDEAFAPFARRHDLATPEAHALMYLEAYGPCTPSACGRVLGHAPSTVTGIVDRLVEKGLAERRPNPRDRRSLLVEVTRAGAATARELAAASRRIEEAVLDRLAPTDLEGFRAVMRALRAATAG